MPWTRVFGGCRGGLLVVGVLLSGVAQAQDPRLNEVEKRLEEQQQENAKLRRDMEVLQRQVYELLEGEPAFENEVPSPDTDAGAESMSQLSKRLAARSGGSYQGGIFDKPFLKQFSQTFVGRVGNSYGIT